MIQPFLLKAIEEREEFQEKKLYDEHQWDEEIRVITETLQKQRHAKELPTSINTVPVLKKASYSPDHDDSDQSNSLWSHVLVLGPARILTLLVEQIEYHQDRE